MNTFKFITILTIVSGIMSGMIYPDHTNPAQLTTKVGSGSQTLTFKFSLPDGAGLGYGGFVGINMSSAGTDFSSITSANYSCSITKSDGSSVAFASQDASNGILYCKHSSMKMADTLTQGSSYTLTLTFTISNRPASFNEVGLFFATSNGANKIFMNNTRVFASIGNYGDYAAITAASNPLGFTSTVRITAGTATTASTSGNTEPFIKDTFETTLKVEIRSRIPKDYDFVIGYSHTHFDMPDSIASSNIDAQSTVANQLAVTGTLTLEKISDGYFRIKGINEDLIPGRTFNLTLSNWKAKEVPVASSALTFNVYYRNTNTVFSYATVASALKVKENTISPVTYNLQEKYPYAVSGMSWPVTITFRPKVSVSNRHVVVKAATATAALQYKFLAASCNFTAMQSTAFGDSMVCHPFQSGSGQTYTNGFHFYAASLSNSADFTFTVWIHISKCGAADVATTSAAVKLALTVETYSSMTNAANGGVLGTKTGASSSTESVFECLQGRYPSGARNTDNAFPTAAESNTTTESYYLYAREITDLQLNNSNTEFDAMTENGLIKELKTKQVDNTANNSATKDIAAKTFSLAQATTNRVYLNTSSSFTSGTTYVNLFAYLGRAPDGTANTNDFKVLPLDRILSTSAIDEVLSNHYLEFIFKKSWFAAGKKVDFNNAPSNPTAVDLCWVGWNVATFTTYAGATVDFTANNLITYTATSTTIEDLNITTAAESYTYFTTALSANPVTAFAGAQFLFQGNTYTTVDMTNSKLPSTTTTHDYYTIKGISLGTTNANKPYNFPGVLPDGGTDKLVMGIFTNCLTLNSNSNATDRSVFDSFELQAVFRHGTTGRYSRIIRMISLNVMSGVFYGATPATAATGATIHSYNAAASFASAQSVCVTAIPTDLKSETTTGNALVAFMTTIQFLNTDYTSRDNSYPVGNLKSSAKAYAFSSVLGVSDDSHVITGNEATGTDKYLTSSVTGADNGPYMDHYIFGSQLWFTGISSNDIGAVSTAGSYALVPHYCVETTLAANKFNALITFAFVDASSYSAVRGKVTPNLNMTTDGIVATFANTNNFDSTKSRSYMLGTFNQKSIAVNHGGSITTNHSFTSLRAIAVLSTSAISYDTTNNGIPSTSSPIALTSLQTSATPVYFMGLKFDKIALGIQTTGATDLYNATGSVNNTITISNILRPDLNGLVDASSNLDLHNDVLIAGVGSKTIDSSAGGAVVFETAAFNNIIVNTTHYAVLSLGTPTTGSVGWTISYSNLDSAYHDNAAIKTTIANNASVTWADNSDFVLTFNADNIDSNTICAMVNADGMYPRACTGGATPSGATGTSFSCRATKAAASYDVCCFNAKIPTANTFLLNNVQVKYNVPTVIATNSSLDFEFTKASNTNAQGNLTDVNETNPTFSRINYNHTKTLKGIGSGLLTVELGKRLNPNNKITISGDFTSLLLYGEAPSCTATVNSSGVFGNWSNGDEIIESCTVDFSSSSGSIVIQTRNMIYRCASQYATTLYVNLHPIVVQNISTLDYKVEIAVGSSNIITPTANNVATKPTSTTTQLTRTVSGTTSNIDPKIVDSSASAHTLCNLTTVYPAIAGLSASYTFTFDFTNVAADFTANAQDPTEITLFLPMSYFGNMGTMDSDCSTSLSTAVNCKWMGSILTLNFKGKPIKPTTDNRFTVTVNNIKAVTAAANSIKYACSLNIVTPQNERKVLAYGRGQYATALPVVAPTSTGKLVFETVATIPTASINPRTSGRIDFGLTFDRASVHSTILSGEQSGNPGFLFTFPSSFPFGKYPQSSITIEVKQVLRTTATEFALETATTVASGKPTVHGNSFFLALNSNVTNDNTKFNFSDRFQYWTVAINNIDFPEDNVVDSGIMNVALINTGNTLVYRTYTNTNNAYYGKINSSGVNFLNYYRGLKFEFDKKSWVVDIYNSESSNMMNTVTVYAGFYNKMTAAVRDYSDLDQFSGELTVAFNTSELTLTTVESSIKIFTVDNKVDFHVGVPCETALGSYLVDVTVGKPDAQATRGVPERKIRMNVMYKTEQITCTKPAISVPKNSRARFQCTAPTTVDAWDIDFVNKDTNDTTSGAKVDKTIKNQQVHGVFSTTFTSTESTVTSVTFTATPTNKCLWMSTSASAGEITFPLDTTSELKNPVQTDLNTFSFRTRADDASLAYNAISLTYTIPAFTELFVVVTCSTQNFPADEEIKSQTNLVGSDSLQYFSAYSENGTTAQTRTLAGFRRNTNYKVKAILRSTATSGTPTEVSETWETMNRGANTTAENIRLVATTKTTCLQFNLYAAISDEAKSRLVNFCQNKYFVNGKANSGCMICTDIDRTIFATGAVLDDNACAASASTLRMLQDTTTTTKTVSAFFVVCAVQDYLCATQLDETSSATTFGTFRDAVDTSEKINQAITGLPAVNSTTRMLQTTTTIDLASVSTINDNAVPEFSACADGVTVATDSCYKFTRTKLDFIGDYEFKITFGGSFSCKYALLKDQGTTMPASTDIDAATTNNGSFFTAAGLERVLVSGSTKTRFVRGETVALYMYCPSRRVINPQTANKVVFKVDSQNFPVLTKNCPNPELDLDKDVEGCTCNGPEDDNGNKPIVNQGTDGDACISTYFGFSLILALITLLFL